MWCFYEMPLYETYFLSEYSDRCKYKWVGCYQCVEMYKRERRKKIKELREEIREKQKEIKQVDIDRAGLVESSKGYKYDTNT